MDYTPTNNVPPDLQRLMDLHYSQQMQQHQGGMELQQMSQQYPQQKMDLQDIHRWLQRQQLDRFLNDHQYRGPFQNQSDTPQGYGGQWNRGENPNMPNVNPNKVPSPAPAQPLPGPGGVRANIPTPSLLERLLLKWQEGARAPNPQPYDPRTYTPPKYMGAPADRAGGGTR